MNKLVLLHPINDWHCTALLCSLPAHVCSLMVTEDIINTSKKESPHLYKGPEFSIWILYGDIISTDL